MNQMFSGKHEVFSWLLILAAIDFEIQPDLISESGILFPEVPAE